MVSKLKKALALVLAAAMVVTVAPVQNAEAAAKYSITKRTSVQADKTYTYTIKGVKKTQYVKINAAKGVVVKYGSKTVKKSAKTKGTVKIKGTEPLVDMRADHEEDGEELHCIYLEQTSSRTVVRHTHILPDFDYNYCCFAYGWIM